jgi:hypothetical protein
MHLPLPRVAAHDADVVTKHAHTPVEGDNSTWEEEGLSAVCGRWDQRQQHQGQLQQAGAMAEKQQQARGGVGGAPLPTHPPEVVDVLKGRHKALGALSRLPNAKVCSMRGRK